MPTMDFHQVTWELLEDWVGGTSPFVLDALTHAPPEAILVQRTDRTVDAMIVPLDPPISVEQARTVLAAVGDLRDLFTRQAASEGPASTNVSEH